jgi:hypothetical protein
LQGRPHAAQHKRIETRDTSDRVRITRRVQSNTTRDTVQYEYNERYGHCVQSNTMKYGKAQDNFVKHIRASIDA